MSSPEAQQHLGVLEGIVEFSLKNKLLMVVLFAIVCVIGVWRLFQLPIDAFPDTTPIQVQINTIAPSLSPEEVEQQEVSPSKP